MASNGAGLRSAWSDNLVLRVGLYYVVLFGVAALVWLLTPDWLLRRVLPTAPLDTLAAVPDTVHGVPVSRAVPSTSPWPASSAALAMVSAVLLALPVAWVYVHTRAKRGYQQSVVQSLIILPAVVAGVVVLVKDSLALAFGLAGIVAAVRFRTAIDDSKDAVHIFLATGLGLAAAVNLPVAAVVSTVFNGVILVLWYSDFGRTPAVLEGGVAERKLNRTLEELNRTGTFVARIDDEVFQDMTAEQLQAVADRAWRRARRHNPELPDLEGRRESLLRLRTFDILGTRHAVEPLLDQQLKRWRFGGVVHDDDGSHVVEYAVLLKKGRPPEEVLETLRVASGDMVVDADLA